MRFAEPYLLLLLIPLAFHAFLVFRGKMNRPVELSFPSFRFFNGYRPSFRARFSRLPLFLRYVVLALLVLALARPQTGVKEEEIITRGVDIMLVLDISGSMKTRDYPPNRLVAAKQVLAEFIKGRKHDMIGLVVFASQSFTQCPLTLNYQVLLDLLNQVYIGTIDENSTAVGLALANATARLKDSDSKSKVIILLTDGQNNVETVNPLTAAEVTKKYGIKVYTVGVGSTSRFLGPESRVDIATLRQIAEITGGEFYLARNRQALAEIYDSIDKLEKSEVITKVYADFDDKYLHFLLPALLIFLLELCLRETLWSVTP